MRLIFAGTPETAVPSLQALLQSRHEVLAVLTRADAPSGRGRRLRPSPVRELAEAHGVDVLTPSSLLDEEVVERLRELAPDAAPVVAYGMLLPPEVLEIPQHGWVNLHFSLLPRWRGAAPAQRAVLAGAESTGMTVFRIDEGLDTGDVLAQEQIPIRPHETAGQLLERMAGDGATFLVSALDALEEGGLEPRPQQGEASHAAKLTPQEARIDWQRDAAAVEAHIRGMSPQPGAWTVLHGQRMKVLGTVPRPADAPELAPGELCGTKKHLMVGTGSHPVALGTVAPSGKRAMAAADWARGAALQPGETFDEEEGR